MKPVNFYIIFACIIMLTAFQAKSETFHTVEVRDFAMDPANLEVTVGDTVAFIWEGPNAHTVTSTSVPEGADHFDEPMNSANDSFVYVITHAGSYEYHCEAHDGTANAHDGFISATEDDPDPNFLLKEESIDLSVKVYPNPASDILRVSSDPGNDHEVELSIMTLSGKVIYRATFDNFNDTKIDVSDMDSGLYLVSLRAADTVANKKFIVE